MEKLKIKILGISCAHRRGRNTSWLTLYALKIIEKFGRRVAQVADIETEFIDLSLQGKDLKLCPDCNQKCLAFDKSLSPKSVEPGVDFECPIQDDYVAKELIPKMAEADGYIFGAPVFTLAYTSKFRLLFDRLRAGVPLGCFTSKPAAAVTTATMLIGGQESCLEFMNICIRDLEMIPVQWMHGGASVSGPPYGPLPYGDDGTFIGVKKDRFGRWFTALAARRVVEISLMQKIARRRLGDVYKREFIQRYHNPDSETSWGWNRLEKEDEEYMVGLDSNAIEKLDGVVVQSKPKGNTTVKCKFLGLSCSHRKGKNTSWLVLHSLKGIEKFGARIADIASFETEFIDLADKDLKPCRNCDRRYELPNGGQPWKTVEMPPGEFGCIIKNDYIAKEILPRVREADGFIFGSPVSTLTPSSRFRLLSERYGADIFRCSTSSKPTANIAVGYTPNGGQETALNMMNVCNRAVEFIPVGWPHGTPATSGPPFGPSFSEGNEKTIGVKNDMMARCLSVYNARRVAEFAVLCKLGKKELGDLYGQEFLQYLHPPHGEASWEWYRLDKEEHDYMMNLTPKMLGR